MEKKVFIVTVELYARAETEMEARRLVAAGLSMMAGGPNIIGCRPIKQSK